MKKVFVFILIALLFGDHFAFADDAADAARAGITPLSGFYFLDQIGKVLQKTFTFGLKNKLELLQSIAAERAAEARIIAREKGFVSKEYTDALGRFADIGEEIAETWKRAGAKEREANTKLAVPLLKALDADTYDLAYEHSEKWGKLAEQKQSLRKAVVDAAKVGDATALEARLKELGQVKYDLNELEHTRPSRLMSFDLLETLLQAIQVIDLTNRTETLSFELEKLEQNKKELLADAKRANVAMPTDLLKRIDENSAAMRELLKSFDANKAEKLGEKIRSDLKKAGKQMAALARAQEEKEKSQAEKKAETERSKKIAEQKRSEKNTESKQGEPLPQAQQNKSLRPLGTPPSPTQGNTIIFGVAPIPILLERGKYNEYSFCEPAVSGPNDLCTAVSTNPTGGEPPYHFVLDSGIDFPPAGMTLHPNGLLSGTPSRIGTYKISVCAVDLAGNQECRTAQLSVVQNEPCWVTNTCSENNAPPSPAPCNEPMPSDTPGCRNGTYECRYGEWKVICPY